jgi:predicted phage-related endonuclease
VPAYYEAQVQHQLMVSGATEAHLWVFAEGEGLLLTIKRDEALMDAIRACWDDFATYLDTDTPSPLAEADSVLREDEAWASAAKAFVEAKRHAESADEALEAARRALVDLVKCPRETGAGINVVKMWKQGTVDYKRIPELAGVNLDRYRGKGREEVRVSVSR